MTDGFVAGRSTEAVYDGVVARVTVIVALAGFPRRNSVYVPRDCRAVGCAERCCECL